MQAQDTLTAAKIEGKIEGEQIGIQKGIEKVAKALLKQGVSLEVIAESTGLSIQEIEKID